VDGHKLSSHTASNVCDTWGSYTDCEYYKKGTGQCYLTSAASVALGYGFRDDCAELTTLRRFRDGYGMENYPEDVERYYELAPMIVVEINAQPDAQEIYRQIFDEMVLPCVALIADGELDDAYARYKAYTLRLEEEYLPAAT
jgi:hypothetical protein